MVKTLWLLLLAVAALPVWAAPSGIHDFSAEVDRRELYVNEHVVLTLSLTGSDTRLRAEGVSPNIDLTVLAGAFELGTPKADFRFNIDNNRGRATSSITVELFPRTAGRLRIPAFTVDGLNTQAIELRVSPLTTDTSPEAFVRSGVASKHLFTGEQALVYLDLYHRVELASARMGGALDSKPRDIAVHTLPASERTERVDGIEYQVTRTAWAASMMQAGEMTLLLPDIWVETRQGRRWRLPFREERIEVRALPAGIAPGTFIGRPSVEITTPETKSAGEAAPWEIVLRGSVALNLLPVQAPLAPPPAGVRVYMDPPEHQLEQTIDGVQSVAIYRGNVLAQSSGTHQTPTIQLPWYDISTGTMAMLELPGKTFETSAAPEQSATAMLPTTDVHSVEPTPAARNSINSTWLWTTALFALLWLITLAAWLRRNNMQRSAHHQPKPRDNEPRQRLLLALNARTLEQGLRQWEACYGHDEAIRAAIRTAQQLSYRKRAAQNDIELTQAIEHALALIGDCRVPTSAQEENHKDPRDDHWSPRAFRHAPDRE